MRSSWLGIRVFLLAGGAVAVVALMESLAPAPPNPEPMMQRLTNRPTALRWKTHSTDSIIGSRTSAGGRSSCCRAGEPERAQQPLFLLGGETGGYKLGVGAAEGFGDLMHAGLGRQCEQGRGARGDVGAQGAEVLGA